MTAQFPDTFIYRGEAYDLAGIEGDVLFDPEAYGLHPVGTCSACWRGHIVGYVIAEGELRVDHLAVTLTPVSRDKDEPTPPVSAPDLNGVPAIRVPDDSPSFFEYTYQDVGLRVPYTGGLLLSSDFIEDLYVHMGFHSAWKYRTVHELVFEQGRLVKEEDVSEKLAEIRREALSRPDKPGSDTDRQNLMAWIARCFSRDYRL